MKQFSILVKAQRGVNAAWVPVSYHGPFSSPEEWEDWMAAHPIVKGEERYQIQYLTK